MKPIDPKIIESVKRQLAATPPGYRSVMVSRMALHAMLEELSAPPAPGPCCTQFEQCTRPCTPRGEWLGLRKARAEVEALKLERDTAVGTTAKRCIEMAMFPQGIDDEQAYYGRMFAEFIEREFKDALAAAPEVPR